MTKPKPSNLVSVARAIVVTTREGKGVEGDPVRYVYHVYDEDLNCVGIIDY